MSGGGGGDGGGGGGGGDETIDCANLLIPSTTLASPDPAVLKSLKVDDLLDLHAKEARRPLLAVTRTIPARTAGSITSGLLARLLKCIEDGYHYVVIVKRIDGGICEVEIRPEVD